jgi:CRP-like cAMP-binding protein
MSLSTTGRGRIDGELCAVCSNHSPALDISCTCLEQASCRTGGAREITAEVNGSGFSPRLREAVSYRDALLDRLGKRNDSGARRGVIGTGTTVLRRKLSGYAQLTCEDAALLGLLEGNWRFVPARRRSIIERSTASHSWLICDGWVYSYEVLASGGRQVMGFHLPGDLIGGNARGDGFFYAAATDCVLREFDRSILMKLRRCETILPDALQWSDAREQAILQQRLISIGRRSAISRVAHLLLELGSRLKLVGLADHHGYKCPLSQELLGDALGLTKIHVNRMLRELRELGCLTFSGGYVSFGDVARLTDVAEYDLAYLGASLA